MEKNTSENEIKLEAEKILKEYAYLDTLDELNGWMWEFLRRSKEYRDFNERAETIKLIFEDKQANDNEDHWNTFWLFILNGFHFFEGKFPIQAVYTEEKNELSFLKKIEQHSFISIHRYVKTKLAWETWMIPRYDMPYNRFYKFDGKPEIRGASPFRILSDDPGIRFESVESLLNLKDKKESDKALRELLTLNADWPPPKGSGSKFTVIISNKVKMKDIETDLVLQIKEHIHKNKHLQELGGLELGPNRKPRSRGDKWKYYLIAYDLRESKKLEHDKIVKIFNSFPGKTGYIKNDIDRYYSEGIQLIEKGKYREFLFF